MIVVSDDFSTLDYWGRIDALTEATARTTAEWDQKESQIAEYGKDGQIVYAA